MRRGAIGQYETVTAANESVRAFVPQALPPTPPLDLSSHACAVRSEAAALALGRLRATLDLLPSPNLLLYHYVRKEAVVSSQIEGTQSSLSDLLEFELQQAPGVPVDDVQDVSCYVDAATHGMERLAQGMPLSNRLLREMHEKLLSHGRGAAQSPGEFRRSQNWIGGTRPVNAAFVPPPPQHVDRLMGELEIFLHDDRIPVLVRAALGHVQFETIHPFLDGNGRLGRLLVPFLLCTNGALREPILYLSLYLKQHRQQYYALLDSVRASGDWEEWFIFFATGVEQTADSAAALAKQLDQLAARDAEAIQALGKIRRSARRLHALFMERPIRSIESLATQSGLTVTATTRAVAALERAGLVRETTGRRRGRLFAYSEYLAALTAE